MVKLIGTFGRLKAEKVLVVGDLLLDTYTIGKAKRISPEAPVPVLQVHKEESRPGGAGNAALNLISLCTQVAALGRVGEDASGEFLKKSLKEETVDVRGVFTDATFKTPIKNRIIAENQQMVRVDHEWITPLPKELEERIINDLPALLEGVKVIAVSDYGKGFVTDRLMSHLIKLAKERGILLIADPKGTDFTKYSGAHLIKPNLSEAYAAAGLPTHSSLEEVAQILLKRVHAEYLMVTRSEAGISIFRNDGGRSDFPTQIREVKDVTGAGDTVLAMLACALASGLNLSEAAELSNVAAGIAIEHLGCARVTLSELAMRLLKNHVENKVFDEEHLYILKHALKDQKCTIMRLDKDEELAPEFVSSLCALKEKKLPLLISVEHPEPKESFINMLASLHPVDFVILNKSKRDFKSRLGG